MRTNAIDPSMSLADAIAMMRAAEDPGGDVTAGMSTSSAKAVDMHDAVHLIFGCGTSLRDEIAAHVWMAFATTAPLREMHRAVANQEHRKALSAIGHFRLLGTWLAMLPTIVGILRRASRMTKKIDYDELPILLGQSLSEIRADHGIVVRGDA